MLRSLFSASLVVFLALGACEDSRNIRGRTPDDVTDEIWSVLGAPTRVLRDDNEVQQIREGRAEAAAQAQELQETKIGAEIAKDAGAAEAGFAKAKQ